MRQRRRRPRPAFSRLEVATKKVPLRLRAMNLSNDSAAVPEVITKPDNTSDDISTHSRPGPWGGDDATTDDGAIHRPPDRPTTYAEWHGGTPPARTGPVNLG